VKRALAAALALLGLCGPALAQQAPRKYALLIGLNRYLRPMSVPPLKYAENDVSELKGVLEKRGYEVTAVRSDEASRGRVIAELYRLAGTVRDTDDLLIYYAGHGVRNRLASRKTYWLTYDADLEYLDVSGIRLQHLLDYVQDIPANRKLILLDHCFSGDIVFTQAPPMPAGPPAPAPAPAPAAPAAPPGPGVRGTGGTVDLTRGGFPLDEIRTQTQSSSRGLLVITAARAGAIEVPRLEHGVFTAALLEALDSRAADGNSDAKLSVLELQTFVKRRTTELAGAIAGVQQEVDVSGTVTNPDQWFVAENLPIPARAEAETKVRQYTVTLNTWEQRGFITRDTKLRCLQVLLDWKDSFAGGRALTETEQALVDKLRQAMEGPPGLERARASDLDTFVSGLPGP
jgi:uncharacterized caspase-like protein